MINPLYTYILSDADLIVTKMCSMYRYLNKYLNK